MIKMCDFQDLLDKKMKDPGFRRAWESQEREFEVAKQIIRLRTRSGMTQKELAEKARTSQPAIARLESGSYRNPSLSFLRKIGEVLGVEPYVSFRKLRPQH